MYRLPVTFIVSGGLHSAFIILLITISWLKGILPDFSEQDDGGGSMEVQSADIAPSALPPLDPDELTPVTITIEDPNVAPVLPQEIPVPATVPVANKVAATPTQGTATTPTDAETATPTKLRPDEGEGGGTGGGTGKNKKPKPPCETEARITQLDGSTWQVQHELIEYYAGNLKAFDRLGYIEPHVNANGQPDGMKVGLSRCSALRQAGVRYGDIVQTVNGLPVNNFSQGLAALVLQNRQISTLRSQRAFNRLLKHVCWD